MPPEKPQPSSGLDSLRAETPLPANVVFVATDPLGTRVYLTEETRDGGGSHSVRHPEAQDVDETRAAIEDPETIAEHTDHSDRRIYLGKPRVPASIELAPIRRVAVAAVKSANTAEVITAFDHARSRRPASMGSTLYDAASAKTTDVTLKGKS